MADKIFEQAGIDRLYPETFPGSGVFLLGVSSGSGGGSLAGEIAGSDLVNDMLIVRPKSGWPPVIHVPAVAVRATATKAAGGVGIRHVCTGFTVTLAQSATGSSAVNLQVNLIDGASGGTNYLWRSTISLVAVPGHSNPIQRTGLWIEGSFNTAMTLEFSAAGGAQVHQSVTLEGVSIE
jgi:hypothetical protein